MFLNQNNGNANQVNTNTRLYTSYSDDCYITIGAWNLQLSLEFHPAKGVDNDGVRQYATDNNDIIRTAISIDNAEAIIEGIEKIVEPAIEKKTAASFAVQLSAGESKKMLSIGFDGKNSYCEIAVGINDAGVGDPNNALRHVFKQRSYFVGYDVSTGTGQQVAVESDFENFKKKISAIYDLAPVTPHSINHNNALKQNYANARKSNNQSNQAGFYTPPAPVGMGGMEDFPL